MKQTHKDRVNELITSLGMSKNKFAKQIGTSSAMISKVTTQEINFGVELAEKIISTFPSVSPTWLLTGIGEMMLPKVGAESLVEPLVKSLQDKKWENSSDSEKQSENAAGTTVEAEKRITNVVEAQRIGGERAKRWAQVRMLESRLYKRHPDLEPLALHEAFELSGIGTYADQLLTYVTNKTQGQIDDVLMRLMDRKTTNEAVITQIKDVTAPLNALSGYFVTAEKAMFDMIRAVVHHYPETEEMIAGTPIALDIMGDIQFVDEAEALEMMDEPQTDTVGDEFGRVLNEKLRQA
ncbi:MAG: helix-turn-helix domain-containing protein, partial [Bacteroidota bacterium]|nr:helix-turn-helix domain-containing protein [Bacteroidota bacterium]